MLAAAGIYLNTALCLPALVPTNALIHVYRSTQTFTKGSAGSFHFHTLSCPSLPSSFTSFLPLISSLPYLPSIHPSLSSPASAHPSLFPSLSPPSPPLPLLPSLSSPPSDHPSLLPSLSPPPSPLPLPSLSSPPHSCRRQTGVSRIQKIGRGRT